jgi:UDP-glucose:glycoprotein glucosyltransferase
MVSFIPDLDQRSDVEIYDTVNTLVNGLKLSKADIRMMNFALSLHIYSPRIEASRTKWLSGPEECARVFFSSGGAPFCELKSEEIAASALVETDIVLIPGSKKIILHGIVEAAGFNDRLQAEKVFCARNNIGLSLRWQFSDDFCATPSLTGYGVELRLKSTEYKASDDSQ